jgi:hypothetical protein
VKNRSKIALLFLPCLITGFFVLANFSLAIDQTVLISAVQTSGVNTNDDFIELYNPTCADINLSDWKIKKRIKSGTESSIGTLKNIIPAKGYYLWENISGTLADKPDYATKTYYLANDYSIALFNKEDVQIDSITWGTNSLPFNNSSVYTANPTKFESLQKSITNKFSILLNYSPKNSTTINTNELKSCTKTPIIPSPIEEPKIYSTDLILNELLPYPATGQDEFIEIYNPADKNVSLESWILHDASKTGKYIFPEGALIQAQNYLVVYKKDFKFALNNSGSESVTLLDPNEKIVSTITYESAKENISYNFDGTTWRWSKFLTPGAENIFNNLPQIKDEVPEKVFVNTYADFFAAGSDQDNDSLKYTWDFGDGHKSYLQNTRHKYENTGKYIVSLTVTDGSEDKIKTFTIEVESFPKLSVKIVALSPNPSGTDTGAEFIGVKNNTKKKINLKNWSIASGTKALANHPITENFYLKPNKITKITYAVAKFTLPNTSGKVELRYPNSKVASHVSYGDKKKSIAEDVTYEKIKSGWQWNNPIAIAPVKKELSSLPAPTENDPAPEPVQEEIPVEIISVPEIEKDLGQSTPAPEWQTKKKTRFSLLNFGLGIKTAQAFSAENPQPPKNHSLFKSFPAQKHWFITLLENLNIKINSLLSSL